MDAMTRDRPFGLPDGLITHTVELPFPPSVNSLWRSDRGRVHKSREYRLWCQEADTLALTQRLFGGRCIRARFEAHVYLDRARSCADLDNVGSKAVLDWAQRAGLISNDRNLWRLTVEWSDSANAPEGCRLILREME